jgi:2-polyprenyl-3-methyl-5-hydroxy-6-metoxy-1,4-benzoquinol methylase
MNKIDGKPVIYHTIKKIYDLCPEAIVRVAAPAFDRDGELEFLREDFKGKAFDISYSHNESPLKRMLHVTKGLSNDSYFVRVDGLNKWFQSKPMRDVLLSKDDGPYDCLKFADDYPVQLTFQKYRVGGIRKVFEMQPDDTFHVHPQYFMALHSDTFVVQTHTAYDEVSDTYLKACRDEAKQVYVEPRLEVNEKKIAAGDQLTFHYKLAEKYVQEGDHVLDIACGEGYGTNIISKRARSIIGGDVDAGAVEKANRINKQSDNTQFRVLDVTKTNLPENHFDVCLSMETIEHVDADLMLGELQRILKPKGRLILSTPQNSMGHIPVTAEHRVEYSYAELKALVEKYFVVEKFIAIKRGCVIVDGDEIGNNSFVVLRNSLTP